MNACMYDKKDEHLREKNINFSQVFTFKRKGIKKKKKQKHKEEYNRRNFTFTFILIRVYQVVESQSLWGVKCYEFRSLLSFLFFLSFCDNPF